MFFDNAPKSAVAYCRVSSAAQEERETIQNQIDFATNYCKLNNIELTHIYKDDGVTGTLPLDERPAGIELLKDAKDSKFTLVLVFKLDRLGRATRVILNAVHDLDNMGVKVRSMTEPFDTSDASGRFLLTILAGVADLERSNILQRMELGSNRAAKAGKYLGGLAPYGYKTNNEGFYVLNNAPIDGIGMSEVDIVRRIFDMALKGISTVNIADNLNALGIPSCCHSRDVRSRIGVNTKWRATTIYRMLKSTTYKGIRKYGKNRKKTIEHEVPPIIPVEIWEQVQKILASNKIMIKGNCNHKYLLRGLMKCEHCGHSYTGASTDGYTYYVDIGRRNWRSQQMDAPCFGKTINREWIENKVWESCLEFIRNPQMVVKSIESEVTRTERIESDIALIQSRIDSNAVENQRLIELYRKGFISMEDISSEFDKVNKEKESLQAELERLKELLRKDDIMCQVDTAVDMLELLRQKVDRPDVPFETKRIVVETMIEKITVNSDYDKTAYITIYFRFGDRKSTTYSKSMARVKGKGKSNNTCNTFSHGSALENVLQVKISFFAPLPYQALARKVREVHKKRT